ncbi:MAG: hypothetical protein VX589_13085 [Myxococcota bacterium]|nr:hypothetical protein [Myxococcota bacterium]
MRWIVCASLIGVLASCGPKPPSERFYGDWHVDIEKTLSLDPETRNLAQSDLRNVRKITQKWMKTIRFSFDKGGTLAIRYGSDVQRHHFKVRAVEPTRVRLETTFEGNTQPLTLRYKDDLMIVVTQERPLVLAQN